MTEKLQVLFSLNIWAKLMCRDCKKNYFEHSGSKILFKKLLSKCCRNVGQEVIPVQKWI